MSATATVSQAHSRRQPTSAPAAPARPQGAPLRSGPGHRPRSGGFAPKFAAAPSAADDPSAGAPRARAGKRRGDDHDILFQRFFKSVGPRTYAAQVKQASNGNHYLVLTEGQRDAKSGDLRKTRLFVYSEDFVEFFRLVKAAAEFIKDHPLPDAVRKKRDEFWAKQPPNASRALPATPASAAVDAGRG